MSQFNNQAHSTIPTCGVDPISSAHIAAHLGRALQVASTTDDLIVIPLDPAYIGHGVLLFESGTNYLSNIRDMLEICLDADETPYVVFYSVRQHDIMDEDDHLQYQIANAWLESNGVQLVDWFVLTSRSIRSIPVEFGDPREWPD